MNADFDERKKSAQTHGIRKKSASPKPVMGVRNIFVNHLKHLKTDAQTR